MQDAEPLEEPLGYEWRCWRSGLARVAGVDEAGRGPLAGPVVAAAVVLPQGVRVADAGDSKTLTRETREELFEEVLTAAFAVGVGASSVREIERDNILVATARAMDRALRNLCCTPDHVVVDGLPLRDFPWEHEAVVRGDGTVHSISCASIIAKVYRDRLMCRLASRYPGYGWERNVGYGTEEHVAALRELGPTPHHRRTFSGVQLRLDLGDEPEEEVSALP